MQTLSASTRATFPLTLCTSAHCKLIGTTDGTFPDFGHHSEREMGGLWFPGIKLLDGFWLRFQDLDADNVNTWVLADVCRQLSTGNCFQYDHGLGHTPVTIRRDQLAPDSVPGVILTYTFENHGDTERHIQIEWRLRTDLRPCWFSEEAGFCFDGRDTGSWNAATQTYAATDEANPWHVLVHCDHAPDSAETGNLWTPQGSGQGTCAALTWNVTLSPHGPWMIRFFITGSDQSREEADTRLRTLVGHRDWHTPKQERMEVLQQYSVLDVNDQTVITAWPWLKVHTEWLTVDAGSCGRALAAGLPEYPWWFGCDNAYAVQGLLCCGRFDLAADTLRLLARYSESVSGTGRIPHEITPVGLCPNPGNTQETAHYVTAVWHYYQWTADLSLIRELLPLLRKCMAWLTKMDGDGDGLPSGYGIIEIRGLNAEMIDTAAYTSQAWSCFADLLKACGASQEEIAAAKDTHQRVRKALNSVLWDEHAASYCDACASPAFVRQRLSEILAHRVKPLKQAEREALESSLAEKEAIGKEAGFLINRNWTIATPLESGEADPDKAQAALNSLWSPELIGPWGAHLSALDDSTMTISTGCFATAFARWGEPDRALSLLRRMCSSFGMSGPGMLSEMSPDYGCSVQAWTLYALYVPVVRHFFGIQPQAGHPVRIAPRMPQAWNCAALTHVRVPGGHLNMKWEARTDGADIILSADTAMHVVIDAPGYACAQEQLTLMAGVPLRISLRRE